jgi:hypothetical protein
MPRNRLAIRQIFESSNEYGFPDLLPELLASEVPTSLHAYCSGRMQDPTGAIHFFVEDFKFQGMWHYPERGARAALNSNAAAILEPDFSLWLDMSLAEQIHAIYQRRWCARKWQEYGVSVIPILSAGVEKTWSFAWDGIPKHCPIVAVQVQTAIDNGYLDAMLQAAIETVQPGILLCYGLQKDLKIDVPCRWYEPFTKQMRRRLNGQRKSIRCRA